MKSIRKGLKDDISDHIFYRRNVVTGLTEQGV